MSERYTALIRGINVGKAKRVAMADLRTLVADLGFTDVKTLLNSGNVVFAGSGKPGAIAVRIEEGMAERLGVSAPVTVITAADLDAVVAENPMAEEIADGSRFLVAFLRDPKDAKRLGPLLSEDWAPEKLAVTRRAAYLSCPDGILGGRLVEAVGRVLGDAVTSRNWKTVLKLQGTSAR